MKKIYFITGGTGSFSKEYIKQLIFYKKAKKIIIFSRDEYKQEMIKSLDYVKKNINLFRFFIGDVRDKDRLDFAINDEIDVLVHAAAMKQVPTSEYNPFEVIKTNIIGAQNVVLACIKSNIKKVIALSTDKAAGPINLYGATKLTSDKIFTSANLFKGKKNSKFSVVRYGNVMGSRGSVLPIFLEQKKNNTFTLTDKRMTRFNISLSDAIKFVFKVEKIMNGGEIFVPKIPSFRVVDLIKAISNKPKLKIIGIRPGEKIHEEMITEGESINTIDMKNLYKIMPSYKKVKNNKIFNYNSFSNKDYLSILDLKKILKIYHD